MRAIIVCVDYGDILSITLPYNRHHFEEVMIVTHRNDVATQWAAKRNHAGLFFTDAFYRDGAIFNKWLALEEGLDAFGRTGLMAIMDADILWPRLAYHNNYERGCLYTPIRRLWIDVREAHPPEAKWSELGTCRDIEWAGYTQIFYADDKHLPPAPWHETNWTHAGGADSMFQKRWPIEKKRRPGWQCLHLGMPGRNWCGRSTHYVDGSLPPDSVNRAIKLRQMVSRRGLDGPDPYAAERIKKAPEPRREAPEPLGGSE